MLPVPVPVSSSAPTPPTEGPDYARVLTHGQIQMIAIGGAIGTGLFLGAGTAITKAGPSLILAYAAAGLVIFAIMRALGELLLYRPVAGSFSEYAREFIGPFAGFATGWTYWITWVVTGMAEITAAGIYVQYWIAIPQWVTALVVLAVLFGANLVSAKVFGTAEFWFSMIKVLTIIGMILLGLGVLIFGFGPSGDTATFANLWQHGGILPNGLWQALLALQVVMFAYVGVELIGVTASEASDPETVLPRAINTIPWRIGLFYVGSLIVILALVPWNDFRVGESPFVRAFDSVGISVAAGVVNFVVLTAALSSCNSGLFSTGRMLQSLAAHGQAPARLERLSSRHVPAAGIAVSAAVMAIGVLVNALVPAKAFTYITSIATIGIIWTWGTILVCQIRYRRQADAGRLPRSSFRMPGAPVTGYIALGFLGCVVVLLGFDADNRVALYAAPVWVAILTVIWIARRRAASEAAEAR